MTKGCESQIVLTQPKLSRLRLHTVAPAWGASVRRIQIVAAIPGDNSACQGTKFHWQQIVKSYNEAKTARHENGPAGPEQHGLDNLCGHFLRGIHGDTAGQAGCHRRFDKARANCEDVHAMRFEARWWFCKKLE